MKEPAAVLGSKLQWQLRQSFGNGVGWQTGRYLVSVLVNREEARFWRRAILVVVEYHGIHTLNSSPQLQTHPNTRIQEIQFQFPVPCSNIYMQTWCHSCQEIYLVAFPLSSSPKQPFQFPITQSCPQPRKHMITFQSNRDPQSFSSSLFLPLRIYQIHEDSSSSSVHPQHDECYDERPWKRGGFPPCVQPRHDINVVGIGGGGSCSILLHHATSRASLEATSILILCVIH